MVRYRDMGVPSMSEFTDYVPLYGEEIVRDAMMGVRIKCLICGQLISIRNRISHVRIPRRMRVTPDQMFRDGYIIVQGRVFVHKRLLGAGTHHVDHAG
jgi:hypothetical protein